MQQTLPRPNTYCRSCQDSTPQHGFLGTRVPAQPVVSAPRRKRSARVQPTAFSGSFNNSVSISNIVSATVFALGALWISRNSEDTQERGSDPECPTCEGTGMTNCICQRWSDGDVGCGACNGTGRCVCPTCGGGGKGVPVYVKVVAEDGSQKQT